MICIDIEKKLKAYNGQQILRIKKEFQKGSITTISGPSGIGKTTLLKIIAGFIDPEKGSIVAGQTKWLDIGMKIFTPPQIRKVGFVFQDYALFPNMTVLDHLKYASNDMNWIGRLMRIGKLEELSSHKPLYLSGGQQQRLSILRALAPKPALLLMDEPFSALDPEMKATLLDELKPLFAELSLTVLIVSHNPNELNGLSTDQFELKVN
jgi:molybdate transport system ATP-binding protein